MANPHIALADTPDWVGAAEDLLSSFLSLDNIDDRLEVMDAVCRRLEQGLYPAFLHILFIIEQHASENEKLLVTSTFLHALHNDRLPEGRIPAWGADTAYTNSGFGHGRSLGPLEFTCAWFSQPGGLPQLSAQEFETITSSFIRLFSITPDIRKNYCERLIRVSEDTISGSLSSTTRIALRRIAERWREGAAAPDLARMYIDEVEQFKGSALTKIVSNPFA